MHRSRAARLVLALLLGFALTAAACGDDDAGDTSDAATQDAATTGGEGDTGDGDGDSTGIDAPSGACLELATAFDQSELSDALASGDDPTTTLEQAARSFDAATDDAPEEIAADLGVLGEVYAALAGAAADIDWAAVQQGDASAAQEVSEFSQIVADRPDFAEASSNLSAWLAENCGVG